MELMETIINELDSRIKNIRIYHPFFSFYTENSKNEEFDMPILLLSVLSFMVYEGKLKAKSLSFMEIKIFIKAFLETAYAYDLDDENSMEFTRNVIEKLDGTYSYYYLKPQKTKQEYLNTTLIVEDINTLGFLITDDGLDFFLKTKEFGDEAQITINLLLFRKQIEAGSFGYAYDLVRRLNIEVIKRIEEKYSILNVVLNGGTLGTEEYSKYWERVSNQFSEEEGIFKSTVQFLRDFYANEVEKTKLTKRDTEKLKDLIRIEEELLKAQNLHTRLIDEVLNMSNDYDKILDIKMKSAFSDKFEFDKMIDKSCSDINDMRVLGAILKPMYAGNIRQVFSIEKIFEPQRVYKAEERITEDYLLDDIGEIETIDTLTKKRVEHNYLTYVKVLMYALLSEHSLTLKDLVMKIRHVEADELLFNVDFVPFLSRLNHSGRDKENAFVKRIALNQVLTKDDGLQNDIEKCVYQVLINDNKFDSFTEIKIETMPEDDVIIDEIIKVTNMRFILK